MSDRYLTPEQFLADARAWDIKRRAMRRAKIFSGVFDAAMGLFALSFIGLICTTLAAPFWLAVAAFLGIPLN